MACFLYPSFVFLGWRGMKTIESNLLEEKKRLKQDKQALEVDLVQVKKERDLARAQITSTSGKALLLNRLILRLIVRSFTSLTIKSVFPLILY